MLKIPNFDYGWLSKWVKNKPKIIGDMVKKYPPDIIYKIKDTGQIVILRSYFECGTVSVISITDLNSDYSVGLVIFGIDPSNLRPFKE